ncbi:hypothetical protein [Carboxylicivirga linearis]|uniref:Restriction endonuclease n=1 Tax=Carboxylicivirga linearis TaxID=1628157 RepID=A0ABS5JVC4_9BACT|nr:hypothetical protein [Carboxylicivirga linearis]MBS2098860.1 hypothetical protein [Carboxylicivirga linearis]
MEIINIENIDMSKYGKIAKGSVYKIHVRIDDIEERAKELIKTISDKSWISGLDIIEQISYEARAEKTITKLVTEIFEKVDNVVTEEFGEYLVSESARDSLCDNFKHIKLPLAEIWKEKKTGNPGFDFHTESESKLLSFGEAKYSSSSNPHTDAINQIVGFIAKNKDKMELTDLKHFCSKEAVGNAIKGHKAYVAAFSVNGQQYDRIFDTALNSKGFEELLGFPELYIIGVEV